MFKWFFSRLSRRLGFIFALFVILPMFLLDVFLVKSQKKQFIHELTESQYVQARLINSQVDSSFYVTGFESVLQELAVRLSQISGARITLIGKDGVVLGDSNVSVDSIQKLPNHKNRPEVRTAMAGQSGASVRYSDTLKEEFLYSAVPVFGNKEIKGVVRVALPLTKINDQFSHVRSSIFWLSGILIMAGLIISIWVSRSISQPVQKMNDLAHRMAEGDYDVRLRDLPRDEHAGLGEALNRMAEKIKKTVSDLTQEKVQLQAVFASMVEAVVAVDETGRVFVINPSFSRNFGVSQEDVSGKSFLEVLRQSQLAGILEEVLSTKVEKSEEIQVFNPDLQIFDAHAYPLMKAAQCRGVLLVLHDITRVRKLEQIRKDFVANVSHELRTPLASIKGYAETLLDGALNDKKNRRDFVAGIESQADRMGKLVDDLLELSAIESGKRSSSVETVDLKELYEDLIPSLEPAAKKNQVKIHIKSLKSISPFQADRNQLKQVFLNLLDNAVKFNKPNGTVVVTAENIAHGIKVVIEDTGIGIPEEDLPRIFERFYRVDKARSRELGGTGLGLSIVKHIIEGMGGSIQV